MKGNKIYKTTLTRDTIITASNLGVGTNGNLILKQDSTGNHNVTLGAGLTGDIDIKKTPNSITVLSWLRDDEGVIVWGEVSSSNTTARLETLEKIAAPFFTGGAKGGIILWGKAANLIPVGWREVTDFRGLTPFGYHSGQTEFNTIWSSGGTKNVTLTINEMPPHSHTYGLASGSGGADGSTGTLVYGTTNTSSVGNGQPFSILNPYRIVMFIEYVG